MNGKNCGCSIETCGCCEEVQAATPQTTENRPGLNALSYRIGTHGTFLESMKAGLATMAVTHPGSDGQIQTYQPLRGLTSRAASDLSIALLDGWATVADVLTFYQERIANEGYLRTATERRSVLELARLVGYSLRLGVASTVFLSYAVDDNQKDPVEIPAGARSQSIPGPGELPQSFETSDPLLARAEWSNLQARLTQPQAFSPLEAETIGALYLQGTATGLKPNDPLLLDFAEDNVQTLRFVESAETDFNHNWTKVTLQGTAPLMAASASNATNRGANPFDALVEPLAKPPKRPFASSAFLPRVLGDAFGARSDNLPQLVSLFSPAIASTIYPAWSNAPPVSKPSQPKVHALRTKAAPFGNNALLKPITNDIGRIVGYEEWPLAESATLELRFQLSPPVVVIGAVALPSRLHVVFKLINGLDTVSVDNDVADGGIVPITGDWKILVNFTKASAVKFTFTNTIAPPVQFEVDSQETLKIGIGSDIRQVSAGHFVHFSSSGNTVSAEYTPNLDVIFSQQIPSAPNGTVLDLDAQYDQIIPGRWVAIVRSEQTKNPGINNPLISKIISTQAISKTDYNMPGKSTELILETPWLNGDDRYLSSIRKTTVYAQSEELPLSEMPFQPLDDTGNIDTDIYGNSIELQGLYDGLQSGRWIVVSGERTDVAVENKAQVAGVKASELLMISAVNQAGNPDVPGDKVHTSLQMAKPMVYRYKRETVSVFANVVKATHGETRNETLGAGDSSKALQSFTLKQFPLTFVPASNPQGVGSTLKVYVNEVEWKETDSLAGLGVKDRNFVTETDDEGKTSMIFGNGQQGARLPTGLENVKAVYRNGIGKPGNVKAEQISLLQTRPLGVKGVVNPLPASGGADRESRDQARENVSLAVQALDRLVSVQDYADFTRTFAGIGKAAARRISDGHRQVIHITIAGADDIPIDKQSDLYANLLDALRQLGDPDLPIQVDLRELLVLVLTANIRLVSGYQWEPVSGVVRQAVLDAFGFQKRAFGQPALLCEIIGLIQGIEGVEYVQVEDFHGIPQKLANADGSRRLLKLEELSRAALGKPIESMPTLTPTTIAPAAPPNNAAPAINSQTLQASLPNPYVAVNLADFENGAIRPAQLGIFTASVQDTLILKQIS